MREYLFFFARGGADEPKKVSTGTSTGAGGKSRCSKNIRISDATTTTTTTTTTTPPHKGNFTSLPRRTRAREKRTPHNRTFGCRKKIKV
jgi:hypothetical protein